MMNNPMLQRLFQMLMSSGGNPGFGAGPTPAAPPAATPPAAMPPAPTPAPGGAPGGFPAGFLGMFGAGSNDLMEKIQALIGQGGGRPVDPGAGAPNVTNVPMPMNTQRDRMAQMPMGPMGTPPRMPPMGPMGTPPRISPMDSQRRALGIQEGLQGQNNFIMRNPTGQRMYPGSDMGPGGTKPKYT